MSEGDVRVTKEQKRPSEVPPLNLNAVQERGEPPVGVFQSVDSTAAPQIAGHAPLQVTLGLPPSTSVRSVLHSTPPTLTDQPKRWSQIVHNVYQHIATESASPCPCPQIHWPRQEKAVTLMGVETASMDLLPEDADYIEAWRAYHSVNCPLHPAHPPQSSAGAATGDTRLRRGPCPRLQVPWLAALYAVFKRVESGFQPSFAACHTIRNALLFDEMFHETFELEVVKEETNFATKIQAELQRTADKCRNLWKEGHCYRPRMQGYLSKRSEVKLKKMLASLRRYETSAIRDGGHSVTPMLSFEDFCIVFQEYLPPRLNPIGPIAPLVPSKPLLGPAGARKRGLTVGERLARDALLGVSLTDQESRMPGRMVTPMTRLMEGPTIGLARSEHYRTIRAHRRRVQQANVQTTEATQIAEEENRKQRLFEAGISEKPLPRRRTQVDHEFQQLKKAYVASDHEIAVLKGQLLGEHEYLTPTADTVQRRITFRLPDRVPADVFHRGMVPPSLLKSPSAVTPRSDHEVLTATPFEDTEPIEETPADSESYVSSTSVIFASEDASFSSSAFS
ncbi:MAG: uncharacterized protein KVP18_004854 [Porospora cf. gigantea A]|nr:MAG: hypothetical protein KVP18_004854 [Porospora cf. gigantea A]